MVQASLRKPMRTRTVAATACTLIALGGFLFFLQPSGEDGPSPQPIADLRGAAPDLRAKLDALGYVEAVETDPDPGRQGVTARKEGAWPGVNYYCSGPSVRFLDMDGGLLHEIELEVPAAPSSGCLAEPYAPGLVAVVRRPVLSLSRWSARTRWSRSGGFHHDIAVDARGRIYTFAMKQQTLRRGDRSVRILGQEIAVLDARGRTVRSIDLLPLLGPLIPQERLDLIERLAPREGRPAAEDYVRSSDVFHPNSIQLVDWPFSSGPGLEALLCIRDLDRVAVVDLEQGRLLWEWGSGELIGPHDPWLLDNGHVLVFDNGARPTLKGARGYSRVVEIDPTTGQLVWEYKQDPPSAFYSPSRGGAQPLPNGNVLITQSTAGRVFEITRDGEIVWDFWNPDFSAGGGARKSIYRMHRMDEAEFRRLSREP